MRFTNVFADFPAISFAWETFLSFRKSRYFMMQILVIEMQNKKNNITNASYK